MVKKLLICLIFIFILCCIGFWLFLESQYRREPLLSDCFQSSRHKVWTCQRKNPNYVSLAEVSSYFKDSILLFEDDKFYKHSGFDWLELKKSFWINLDAGKYERGGSTITQQLIKNLYLSSKKKIYRKIVEAYFTYKIEKQFSKDLILEKYINIVHFAPRTYGIKKASQKFFSKLPKDLSLLESLFTASVLSRPSVYSKQASNLYTLTDNYKTRLRVRLKRLFEREQITQEDYDATIPFLCLASSEDPDCLQKKSKTATDVKIEEESKLQL